MTQRFNLFLAAILLLIGLPGYWLLFDNTSPRPPAAPVTIEQLRAAAASLPVQSPLRIEAEAIAGERIAQSYYAAGAGLAPVRAVTMALRFPMADGHSLVVDSGPGLANARALSIEGFDAAAQARVEAAAASADKVVVTGAGPEKTGGLAALVARGASGANLWLTAPQLDAVFSAREGATAEEQKPRLSGTGLQVVAPGVVVIPTPGIASEDAQMIYVRLASGAEYLLCGDVSPLRANWGRLRLFSRLAEPGSDSESRARHFAWLRTIQALKREAPALVVVPGRDSMPLAGVPGFPPAGSL